mmetsp:Transcript_10514/g.25070  ORF Transcript_10514/g.25070 Transcript_10514/m.25070 type:complete len:504 (+) Transcript_10514:258-1769(+)
MSKDVATAVSENQVYDENNDDGDADLTMATTAREDRTDVIIVTTHGSGEEDDDEEDATNAATTSVGSGSWTSRKSRCERSNSNNSSNKSSNQQGIISIISFIVVFAAIVLGQAIPIVLTLLVDVADAGQVQVFITAAFVVSASTNALVWLMMFWWSSSSSSTAAAAKEEGDEGEEDTAAEDPAGGGGVDIRSTSLTKNSNTAASTTTRGEGRGGGENGKGDDGDEAKEPSSPATVSKMNATTTKDNSSCSSCSCTFCCWFSFCCSYNNAVASLSSSSILFLDLWSYRRPCCLTKLLKLQNFVVCLVFGLATIVVWTTVSIIDGQCFITSFIKTIVFGCIVLMDVGIMNFYRTSYTQQRKQDHEECTHDTSSTTKSRFCRRIRWTYWVCLSLMAVVSLGYGIVYIQQQQEEKDGGTTTTTAVEKTTTVVLDVVNWILFGSMLVYNLVLYPYQFFSSKSSNQHQHQLSADAEKKNDEHCCSNSSSSCCDGGECKHQLQDEELQRV